MPASWTLSGPYFLVFAFLCGVAGFRVGWRLRGRFLLPVCQGLFGWMAFLAAWRFVGAAWAAGAVLAWALGTTLASVHAFLRHPREADERVLRARTYREGMLEWIETGRGPEQRPAATSASHARETIWYAAAAVLTANLASIGLGAVLLNYMNAYVATLLRAAVMPGRVLLLAWNVWSVTRVVAYVLLGAAAAGPMLRVFGWGADATVLRRLAIAAGAGLVLDLSLKLALSRRCAAALAASVDVQAARAGRSASHPLVLDLD
ncbi:MAG TPA: hypothetical protein VFB67_08220 [Candidatus Polarisedimenticolaceae bacterium]|nr:hypothetical protein [Candidatus Polarisedimenticolaceae bacterium]